MKLKTDCCWHTVRRGFFFFLTFDFWNILVKSGQDVNFGRLKNWEFCEIVFFGKLNFGQFRKLNFGQFGKLNFEQIVKKWVIFHSCLLQFQFQALVGTHLGCPIDFPCENEWDTTTLKKEATAKSRTELRIPTLIPSRVLSGFDRTQPLSLVWINSSLLQS